MLLIPVAILILLTSGSLDTQARTAPHTVQKRSSVCYGDLGCFSNDAPFYSLYRPISFLPKAPDLINPTFNIFTRESNEGQGGEGHILEAGDPEAPGMSLFKPSRPTKFIVHGYVDNVHAGNWMDDMKNAFIQQGDYNVIVVDWAFGSFALYGQATANTRVVGATIAQMIDFLQNVTGAKPEDMHIIGHSLGAHIAGYAGERLHYLGRITGLDPAEPYFQNMDITVRLDPTDALFVDIIHTDAAPFYSVSHGLGMSQACGHVDFYVNGGHDQPGCDKSPIFHIMENGLVEGARESVACNHLRSYRLFTESITSVCPFVGFRCASEEDFNVGKCLPCQGEDCSFMGLHADRVKPSGVDVTLNKYFLLTAGSHPFCRYHYKVALTFSSLHHAQQERGTMHIILQGTRGKIEETRLNHADFYIKPGSTYTYLVTSAFDIGKVHDVTFRWLHNSHILDLGSWNPFNIRHPTLYVHNVLLTGQEANNTITLCGNNMAVQTGVYRRFSTPC